MNKNPLVRRDFYKFGHKHQYDPGTTMIYTNLTARGSRLPVNYAVSLGFQRYFQYLEELWGPFFDSPKLRDKYIKEQVYLEKGSLGTDTDVKSLMNLWDLGYLPIQFNAIPEGTRVPVRVPMLTMHNTIDEFFWLPQALETDMSCETWRGITSATQATIFRELFNNALIEAGEEPAFAAFMGHDFSERGMGGYGDAISSAIGHLTCFSGTDTAPAILEINDIYGEPKDGSMWGYSVPASEHSCICLGLEENELETIKRIITDVYPTGIYSQVSDTWNLWRVLNEYVPKLKNIIMSRDGKLVIRPDSGDPEKIVCGDPTSSDPAVAEGVIKSLMRTLGKQTNASGFSRPVDQAGCIYGDGITLDRARAICNNLLSQKISPKSMVFGIGSFTYVYTTRDTLYMAYKATAGIVNGEFRQISKNPVTDDGKKKSAAGICKVVKDHDGNLSLVDKGTDLNDQGELIPVWKDGYFLNTTTFEEVRKRTGVWL